MQRKNILVDEVVSLHHGVMYSAQKTMEISGQVGIDLNTLEMVEGGIREQTIKVLENIEFILSNVNWTLQNVVKVRIYVTDIEFGKIVNEEYGKKFTSNYPTRLMVCVKTLPLNALVEMECTAVGE